MSDLPESSLERFKQAPWPDLGNLLPNKLDASQPEFGRDLERRLSQLEEASDTLEADKTGRFDRDEVPEATSPPEEWNNAFLRHRWRIPGQPVPSTQEVLDSLAHLLNPPLVADELDVFYDICLKLCDVVDGRLRSELDHEEARIESFVKSDQCVLETYTFLRDPEFGSERVKIIARHFVKRRWKFLGLWVESWGIPGRYYQWSKERDDFSSWTTRWSWKRVDQDGDREMTPRCIIKLIQDLQSCFRGQQCLVQARKPLDQDAGPFEVWDFITSRPWFLWEIEKAVERIRFQRLPRLIREMFDSPSTGPDDLKNVHNRVAQMWRQRMDEESLSWAEPPENENDMCGWWWPHETRSFAEEDLTILNDIEHVTNLTTYSRMEYTESECEALKELAPGDWTASERRQKRVRFEVEEAEQWAEEKKQSQILISRYDEEARQFSNLFSSRDNTGVLDGEVEHSRQPILLPWVTQDDHASLSEETSCAESEDESGIISADQWSPTTTTHALGCDTCSRYTSESTAIPALPQASLESNTDLQQSCSVFVPLDQPASGPAENHPNERIAPQPKIMLRVTKKRSFDELINGTQGSRDLLPLVEGAGSCPPNIKRVKHMRDSFSGPENLSEVHEWIAKDTTRNTSLEQVTSSRNPLKPIKNAGVKKRTLNKAGCLGPLRRSTRAAAAIATKKLAETNW